MKLQIQAEVKKRSTMGMEALISLSIIPLMIYDICRAVD